MIRNPFGIPGGRKQSETHKEPYEFISSNQIKITITGEGTTYAKVGYSNEMLTVEWSEYIDGSKYDNKATFKKAANYYTQEEYDNKYQDIDTPYTLPVLDSGWNLLGYSGIQASGIETILSTTSMSVKSVWKWKDNDWAVNLPGDSDGGLTYASSKGFAFLENIEPGEGFWVNVE